MVKDCEGIWRKDQLDEIDEINEDEIGLSDILARDLFKLQGKISDDLFYKLNRLHFQT